MDVINSGVKWRREALPLPGTTERCCSKYPIPSSLDLFEWWTGKIGEMRGNLYSLSTWDVPGSVYIISFSSHWDIQIKQMLLLLFSRYVVSISLWPHGLQHTRIPCHSLSPRVCSNSCPLSQRCYLTITSSAAFFFSLQSFPAVGSLPVSQLFASGGQVIWCGGQDEINSKENC